jgi:hypothetical protein
VLVSLRGATTKGPEVAMTGIKHRWGSDAILSSRRVSFLGPPMTRRMRGALSAARITTIDRRRTAGWNGQIQEYLVSLDARDGEDAVARVLAVLSADGSFSAFALAES